MKTMTDDYIKQSLRYLTRELTTNPELKGKCCEILVTVLKQPEENHHLWRVSSSWQGMKFSDTRPLEDTE